MRRELQVNIRRNLYPYTRYLPQGMRPSVQRKLTTGMYRDFMKLQLGNFYVNVDEGPVPPDDITMRTSVLNEDSIKNVLRDDHFFGSAYIQLYSWLSLLKDYGFNLRAASTIMELGCGSARLLRHLRCIYGVRLIGTDVEADKIEWCRENLPGIEFYAHDYDPPIHQIDDCTADLIYAASVFTHIPLATQDSWIAEMNRILKPGGFLVATVLGRTFEDAMLTPEQKQTVLDVGRFELTAEDEGVSISSKLTGQWDVFQRRSEVIDVYGKHFLVRDYFSAPQDLLILQKAPAESHDYSFRR